MIGILDVLMALERTAMAGVNSRLYKAIRVAAQ
jgi:hypothetical protein